MPGPLIAGRRYSFSSIEIAAKIGLTSQELFMDVDNITYAEALEIAFKNGTSRVPLGSTAGVWVPQEGTMSMGKSTFQSMVQKVGPGWMGINAVLTVMYADIGEILTVDIITCRLLRCNESHAHGPEALNVELAFMPITPILRNGVTAMLNRVV